MTSPADGSPRLPSGLMRTLPGKGVSTEEARRARLDFVRDMGFPTLELIARTDFRAEQVHHNIEGFVGAVDIPVGLAGPLLIRGCRANGVHFLPMATTEGALVASATRGAAALSRSGGVVTRVFEQRMQRVPAMQLDSIGDVVRVSEWLAIQLPALREIVAEHSRHASLVKVEPIPAGRMLHLCFTYETGDATGQNMTTICTWHACLWLLERMKAELSIEPKGFAIDANRSSDKKLSHQTFQGCRGIRVMAEATLDREAIRGVLKTMPETLFDFLHWTCESAIAIGMIGFNINVANVIAAAFMATGQDVACVHESSAAQLHIARPGPDGSLYVSMHIPSLIVGTVGGGTGLPRQREALNFLGCAGAGKAGRLAEIICGFALALDLSTSAALAAGHFANAHEAMGRNRPEANDSGAMQPPLPILA